MLGWDIIVHTEFTESTNQDDWRLPKEESVLATWTTGLGGDSWLIKLAADGKAKFLGGNGYPQRYLANSKHIFSLIKSGPPAHTGPLVIGENYATPRGWVTDVIINQNKIDQILPNTMLVVDAWDLD